MVLAGGVGGILTLLGAYALLGSGILANIGLLAENDTTAADTQISELANRVSGLSEQSAALSDRIETLANQPAAPDSSAAPDTSAASDTSAALAAEIEALQERVEADLASNRTALEGTGTTLANMQANIEDLQQQLSVISEASASQNQAVTDALATLTERQNSLETSVANGSAGEAPALATLESRLTALSDQMQAQAQAQAPEATVPDALRQELNVLAETVAKLQLQTSITENLEILAQQQQSDLQSLTSTVESVASKTDRLEASAAAPQEAESDDVTEGARLAYMQGALSASVDDGLPFAGLLSQAGEVLAENGSEVELPADFTEAARSGLTPLPQIAGEISEARSTYEATLAPQGTATQAEPAADEVTAKGLLDGIMKGAQSLVTVRTVAEKQTAPADLLSRQLSEAEQAARAGDTGKLSATLETIAANPAASEELQQAVSVWQAQARHHQSAAGLLQQLDAVEKTLWARTGKGDRT